MRLTYVYHSCFVLEDKKFTLIFDFYKDSQEKYIGQNLARFPGKLYVFSSHSHRDHFNSEILAWKRIRPDVQYIFSKDILDAGLYKGDEAFVIEKFGTYVDDLLTVKAFGSTDLGVSFLVEANGEKIFHAGDLNNWHWKEESTAEEVRQAEEFYLSELAHLVNETDHLNVLMFPVDHRLGEEYTRGAEQILDKIKVDLFVPMHFWEHYADANAFCTKAETLGSRFFVINKQQDFIEYL
jgi:L-ascorbate metabolism protein UlaG (beta-lactamase superfamily)